MHTSIWELQNIAAVQLNTEVSSGVGDVVPLLIGLRGDAFGHMSVGGVPLDPGCPNRVRAFRFNSFNKVLPKIPIADEFPLDLTLPSTLEQAEKVVGRADEDATVGCYVHRPMGRDSNDPRRWLGAGGAP